MKINYKVTGSLQEFLELYFPELSVEYIIDLCLQDRTLKIRKEMHKVVYYYNDANRFSFSSAFCWEPTPEGHAFWKDVQSKWSYYTTQYRLNLPPEEPSQFGFYKNRTTTPLDNSLLFKALTEWSNHQEIYETFNEGVI
jgi:hypothetical protein